MAIKLKPGAKKGVYTIVQHLNSGAFANAYEATNDKGRRVFLKEYKSPTVKVNWFQAYVDYQQELKRRITGNAAAAQLCIEFVEFFVEGPFFYQVFEFVDTGMSLQRWLDNIDDGSRSPSGKERKTFAKVMMNGIRILHDLGVIHTDLKPENIYLIEDNTIGVGYRLRVIDMDWALISGSRAPWDGIQGYVGTERYQSPEHVRGEVPDRPSDVFTCGIMLSQILGKGHPFDGVADYTEAVRLGGMHWQTELLESDSAEQCELLERIIDACFHMEASKRPTAAELHGALMGTPADNLRAESKRGRRPEKLEPVALEKVTLDVPAAPAPAPATGAGLSMLVRIDFEGNPIKTVRIDTVFGKYHFKGIHEDARFMGDEQFKIYRDGSGVWMLSAMPGTVNQTLCGGAAVDSAVVVTDGLRIGVGNASKGVEKLPLTLHLVAA